MTTWSCASAWLGGATATAEVVVEEAGGVITAVHPGRPAPRGSLRLAGVVIPGMANTHSHAFHRALRSRSERGGGSFWTWREQMYEVAGRLDPDRYLSLARAAYAEMAMAGVSCVGEFHYLHHRPDGRPYADPNVMASALLAAADDAGIRLTLLDACYLEGGPGRALAGAQLAFGDGSTSAWADRVSSLSATATARIGAAVHSVRAVPPPAAAEVAAWARAEGMPLHLHLAEQPAEVSACEGIYGASPVEVVADAGVLGPSTTAVHATHLSPPDRGLLAASGAGVCMCPTTERDLADGIGPARALADAGVALSLGSDSHAVVDLLEEARAMELDDRLASGARGSWPAAALLDAATSAGHAALGWPGAGRIAVGAPADLVAVSLDSVRTAGAGAEHLVEAVVFAAGATDVTDVVVGGRRVVAGGRHLLVGDVPAALASAIAAVAG